MYYVLTYALKKKKTATINETKSQSIEFLEKYML